MAVATIILAFLFVGVISIGAYIISTHKSGHEQIDLIVRSRELTESLVALKAKVDGRLTDLPERSCGTSNHEIEAVYDEESPQLSIGTISALSNAARGNHENVEDLIKQATKPKKTYVHSVCHRCGTVFAVRGATTGSSAGSSSSVLDEDLA